MKSKQETFASLLQSFEYHYDLRTVFDDFLTMTLCAFSPNPLTGKSHDEDLYMDTIARYKRDTLRHQFPKLLAALVQEMEEQTGDPLGNDVLGTFYETHLYRKGAQQYFTPWYVCEFMAASLTGSDHKDKGKPLRVLDPCCGSGRMLLTAGKHIGKEHEFYGIDIDHICVKMTAINLFLNGMFHSEVMWSDGLQPDDFRMSYKISFLPFGIFRIQDKEQSRLWQLMRHSFHQSKKVKLNIQLPSESGNKEDGTNMSQLTLF